MTEFFIILIEPQSGSPDWSHPSQLNARSKQQAMKLVCENTEAQYVAGIFTKDEYLTKIGAIRRDVAAQSQIQQQQMQSFNIPQEDSQSAEDFFKQALADAMDQPPEAKESEQTVEQVQEPVTQVKAGAKEIQVYDVQPVQKSQPKFFTDNGVDFKVEDGIVYKKTWITVDLTDEANRKEFRIINLKSGKPSRSQKYGIQQCVWRRILQA